MKRTNMKKSKNMDDKLGGANYGILHILYQITIHLSNNVIVHPKIMCF